MQDVLSLVAALRRPPMLVQAARFGLDAYRRPAHLARLLGAAGPLPGPGAAIVHLLELEAALDQRRRERAADYRAARHVAILVAIMGEARDLRACTVAADQTKASGIESFLRAT
ncbi:MAG: hypothetical protein H3C51_09275 [Rubellimicrobium sp.]|nr:hypothetical protein [Rubellimicrobium sp.]